MRKTLIIVTFIVLIAEAAAAQTTVRCESDGKYRECELDALGRVTLSRQISRTACVEGESWGYRDGRVWVDRGCRADFTVTQRTYGSSPRGQQTTIVCESVNNRRVNCPVDTRSGVTFSRQLSRSACVEGTSWGYLRGSVWVDAGCRAEFIVSEGGLRNDRGRRQRLDQLLVCESDGKLRRCPANTTRGVELSRQISRTACEFGRDWGYDRGNVWVTNGCRAEFAVAGGGGGGRIDRDNSSRGDEVGQLVRCESNDNRRSLCRADTRGGVQLFRQLSDADCVRNETWGYDRDGIWVSGGCRADFELNGRR